MLDNMRISKKNRRMRMSKSRSKRSHNQNNQRITMKILRCWMRAHKLALKG